MTQRQLDRLLSKWRKKLRLEAPAWEEVSFEFKGEDEMEDHLGWCDWSRETGKAWGAILDTQSLTARGEDSAEAVLVHELLHILFQGHLHRNPKYDPDFERALNVITKLLVPEKTRGKKSNTRSD